MSIRPVFDSNILIDAFKGLQQAKTEIQRYPVSCISTISWVEVLVGARSKEEEEILRLFLSNFVLIAIDKHVCDHAIKVRREKRLKLPDAIIYASALSQHTLLVTRNAKDFDPNDPMIRVPYTL